MRKNLQLLAALILMCAVGTAQVSFFVEAPSPNEGGYEISNADGTDWGSPDMTDPANVVSATMCLAQEDSLVCDGFASITNAAELDGKIAVVYRGACEFGFKAKAVQDAGAVACIIVNHSPGVIPMGGGAEGLNVTIPVIMISNADGALLYDDFLNCTSTAIIGNLNGFFANNLRLTQGTLLRPASFGRIAALSQDDTEFSVETGAWVYNFGQEEDDSVVLNVSVDVAGDNIYDESAPAVAIPAGDSAYISMPTFSEGSYVSGRHTMTYTVSGSEADEFTADNTSPANFNMGTTYSYSNLDDDNRAAPTNYTSAATFVGTQNYCIYFEDPNASRVAVTGFDFTGTHFTETITDYEIEVVIYEWGDEYAGLNTTFEDFSELDSEAYSFEEGDDDQIITLNFDTPIELDDEVRYAFCLRHDNEGLQLGFDNKTDYTTNVYGPDGASGSQVPIFPYWDEVESFPLLFGTDLAPAFSVQMLSLVDGVEEISNEVEVVPFPNPAAEYISIPFKKQMFGKTLLTIYDIEGKIASTQSVISTGTNLRVDVTNLPNGNYVFNLQYEDGNESTFNVVVNR